MEDKKDHINILLSDPEFVKWVKNPDKDLDIYWENWIAAHPDRVCQVKTAKEIILGLRFTQLGEASDLKKDILHRILTKERALDKNRHGEISGSPISEKPKTVRQSKFFWIYMSQWTKVAAILIFVLFFSLLAQWYAYVPVHMDEPVVEETAMIAKRTLFGEKLNFKLPDGTSVWLNSGSGLIYPETFDSLSRTVTLLGEGYFEIVEDNARPFKVVSGDLTTVAIGTAFNINQLNEEKLCISLLNGKVKVENNLTEENIILDPGQQLRYFPVTKKSSVGKFSAEDIMAWKEGVLRFSNASFWHVVNSLERWYGVKITVSGRPDNSWLLTGAYKNQNLDLVLERMAYIEAFEYSIKQKNVHLKFK